MAPSALQTIASSPAVCSSSVLVSRKSVNSIQNPSIPRFQGLKAALQGAARASNFERNNRSARRVICEAKETTETEVAGPVTDDTFKSLVLENSGLVLVDFWAPWCGPCRMLSPVIDSLAVKFAGKVTCLKLNTDESPAVATEYGIRSIPTVMLFKGGKKLDAVIGAVPEKTLESTIEKFL